MKYDFNKAMDLKQLVHSTEEYVLALRREFHFNPEIGGKETRTLGRIKEELDAMGISYIVVEDGGILATIEGAKPGKHLLLRADIDALPVKESPENLKGKKNTVSLHGHSHGSSYSDLHGIHQHRNSPASAVSYCPGSRNPCSCLNRSIPLRIYNR